MKPAGIGDYSRHIIFCMKNFFKNSLLVYFFFTYLIWFNFLNCSAQQSTKHMNINYLKENGEYIHYHVLPEKKDIDISLIASKEQFEKILKEKEGIKVSKDTLMQIGIQRNYIEGFFLSTCNSADVYQLNGGTFLVNQLSTNKPNPYFLAASLEDVILVFAYVLILHEEIDSVNHTFVKSSIFNHDAIYNFLVNTDLVWNEEKSSDIHKLYIAKNGQCVMVRYSKKGKSRINVSPEQQESNQVNGIPNNEYYYSAIIYQSIEDMQLLGVFEQELDDIDETNFSDYSTYIFLAEGTKIPVKILNSQGKSIPTKSKGERLTGLGVGNEELEVYKGNGDTRYLKYNDYLFIQFKTTQDLIKCARKADAPNLQKLCLELTDAMLNSANSVVSLPAPFIPVSDSGSYEKILQRLDKNLNQFFFDDQFINMHFVPLAIYIGKLAEQKGVGKFIYDKDVKCWVIVTKKGTALNFTAYLFEEMVRQKYTANCLTEGIMGGLLASELINVVPNK